MQAEAPDVVVLTESLLDYLRRGKDRRVTAYRLAAKFDVSLDIMRPLLESLERRRLLRRSVVPRRGFYYYVPKGDPIEEKTAFERVKAKEYKPGPEWDYVNQRLAEFRKIKSKY